MAVLAKVAYFEFAKRWRNRALMASEVQGCMGRRVLMVLLFATVFPFVGLQFAQGQDAGGMHLYMFDQLNINPGYAGSSGLIRPTP